MAEFGDVGCCCCCRTCVACCDHALCRQVAIGLNTVMPGLCPVKETDRLWGDGTSGPRVRASWWAYLAREHSVTGMLFAPTSRPTDLHKIQLLLVFLLGAVVALYLSIEASERFPEWMNTWWEWWPILAINALTSFFKVCYKSGLKRTYFCTVQCPGLLVCGITVAKGGGFLMKKSPAKEVYAVMSLGLASSRAAVTWDSEAMAWLSDPSEELCLPLRYETLVLKVVQVLQDGTEQVIGRTECDVEKLAPEPGSRINLSLKLGPGICGKVDFLLCTTRDEPISALDFLLAVFRPLTECILFRCCFLVMFLPCVCCHRACTMRKRSGTASDKKPGATPARSARGFPGAVWRGVLRLFACAVVIAAGAHLTVIALSRDADKLAAAAELFVKAKLFGWFVTEPGALLWTYWTMYCFCPVLLPQQSLEKPRPSRTVTLVDPIAVVDSARMESRLIEASSPKGKRAGCELQ